MCSQNYAGSKSEMAQSHLTNGSDLAHPGSEPLGQGSNEYGTDFH